MMVLDRPATAWRWDVDKLHTALDSGLIAGDERLELIDGFLEDKMPQTDFHASLVDFLVDALREAYGVGHTARSSQPVRLGKYSEPEPDIAVMRGVRDDFLGRKPGPTEITLIVEVSFTTLAFDLGRKKALYARHGVEEYHVYDLEHERLEIFTRPDPSGEYLSHVTVLADGEIPRLGLTLGPLLARARGEAPHVGG